MKYIDADKLIAEIEKRLKNIRDYINGIGMKYKGPKFYKARGKESAYDELLSIIYFLQQEQPEGLHFTPLNRLIQKIPSEKWNDTVNNYAKKLRDCLIKEGYLKDAEVLQGYISYMNGNNVPMATMDELDQSDMDLDKKMIIDYVHNHYHYDKDFDGYGHSNLRPVFTREDLIDLARHFYELGLNARKK